MSVFSYNSVTLPYCYHTAFRQEAVYDDSVTDKTITKFDISVQAVLNTAYAGIAGVPAGNGAAMMKAIRAKLLTPRQTLSVQFNGVELIPTTARGIGGVDAKNGPQPQFCEIISLNNTTFLILFRITANYVETTAGVGGSSVISNRWEESVSLDDMMYTTRTRSGKFFIRSDNAAHSQPDEIRSKFAVVGVPKGFLRVSSQYTITPDGLGLQYQVVDKEQFKMPPSPAFKAHGEYLETTAKNGHMRYGECFVRLEGSKQTDQSKLISTCVQVCAGKLVIAGSDLTFNGNKGLGFTVLQASTIKVDMYNNMVECRMRALMKPRLSASGKGRFSGLAGVRLDDLPLTPGSDGINYSPNYTDRGSADFLLQAAAYYDPALQNSLNRDSGQMNKGSAPGA